jgi:hypothetical protein
MVCTISTVSLYVMGFSFLLPDFYSTLPSFVLTYIIVSFIVLFIALVFFLRKKVKKELNGFNEIIIGLQKTIESFSKAE